MERVKRIFIINLWCIEIFNELDPEQYNSIPSTDLPRMFEAVGRDPEEAENLLQKIDPEGEGRITYPDCCAILDRPPVEGIFVIYKIFYFR